MTSHNAAHPWDLVVLGGGTAGMVGARTAASFGARVLLVERKRTGGDCLWTGCVPSKSLLAAASAAADARAAARLGVRVSGVEVDFAAVMRHVHQAIDTIEPEDGPQALQDAGVTVLKGTAKFVAADSISVDGQVVLFRSALVATGASPLVPPVPGLADADYVTSETVWALTALPERLVVLGGGPIGCELGQGFARLGARVTIVDAADRLLSREDRAGSRIVEAALRGDGIELRLGRKATEVRTDGAGGHLLLDDGSSVGYDRLLVAVGRRAQVQDLDCPAGAVELAADGTIAVDDHLRTSNSRVWAAGDVTGGPQFTHTAGVDGSMAAVNAVLGLRRSPDPVVPRVTYTSPEVAAVGMSTSEPLPEGHTLLRWGHRQVDRAVTEADTEGFTALVVDCHGVLKGATVVGPRAGETLGELTLAIRKGLTTRDLAATTHPYPTYNDGVWKPVVEHVRERLSQRPIGPAVRAMVGLRRTWLKYRP